MKPVLAITIDDLNLLLEELQKEHPRQSNPELIESHLRHFALMLSVRAARHSILAEVLVDKNHKAVS